MGKMIDVSRNIGEGYLQYFDSIMDGLLKGRSVKYVQAKKAHGGNTISSGMAAGTVCEADADASGSPGADGAPAASSDDDGGDPDPEPARPRSCNTPPPAIAPHPHGTTRRNATATAGDSLASTPNPELWRLSQVLAHVTVSRSTWFAGVKAGRYPQPVRLSDRRVAWRASDIRSFVAAL